MTSLKSAAKETKRGTGQTASRRLFLIRYFDQSIHQAWVALSISHSQRVGSTSHCSLDNSIGFESTYPVSFIRE